MNRLYRSLLIILLVTSAHGAAAAHDLVHRVVVVGPSAEHETVVRVQQELALLGFSVHFHGAAAGPAELAALGRQHGAAAVARVEDWPPEIIIWVDPAASATSAGTGDEIRVSDSLSEPAQSQLLAVRAVELLRGSLLPLPQRDAPPAQPAPTSGGPPAPAPVPTAVAPAMAAGDAPSPAVEPADGPSGERHYGAVQLGPALLLSPGGVPPTPHVLLGGELHLVWRLAADVLVLIPTTAATVSAAEGTMQMRTMLLAGGLSVGLTEPDSAWLARAGVGLGAAGLFYSGEADAPFAAEDGTAWAAAPYGTVGAGYRVHSIVALRADGLLAIMVPEPVLRIAGNEAASFGQPAVVVGLGVEVRP